MGPVPAPVIARAVGEVEKLQALTGLEQGNWLRVIAGYERS